MCKTIDHEPWAVFAGYDCSWKLMDVLSLQAKGVEVNATPKSKDPYFDSDAEDDEDEEYSNALSRAKYDVASSVRNFFYFEHRSPDPFFFFFPRPRRRRSLLSRDAPSSPPNGKAPPQPPEIRPPPQPEEVT